MTDQTLHSPEHDEIMALLPWFVNRTLENDQRTAVLRHLKSCDTCRNEVQFLEVLSETVQDDAQGEQNKRPDVEKNLNAVLNRIDADGKRTSFFIDKLSLVGNKLRDLFSFATALPAYQLGATALAAVLVVALGFQMFSSQSDDEYSVLSSPDIASSSMQLSVELDTSVNAEQIRPLIVSESSKLNLDVTVELIDNKSYLVVFENDVDVSSLREFVSALESEGGIESVQIVP